MSIRLPPNVTPGDTLLLRKVPPNANTVDKMFKHFKRFGRIHGIWCSGTEAMISFERQEDCKAAFESPEAYANNRFVRFLYPEDPDHAESKLSQFADFPGVMGIVDEVKAKIAEAVQEANQLRSNMQEQQQQEKQKEQLSELDAMVMECQAQRDRHFAQLKELKAKLEKNPDDADIQSQISQVESDVRECEAMIADILKTRDNL